MIQGIAFYPGAGIPANGISSNQGDVDAMQAMVDSATPPGGIFVGGLDDTFNLTNCYYDWDAGEVKKRPATSVTVDADKVVSGVGDKAAVLYLYQADGTYKDSGPATDGLDLSTIERHPKTGPFAWRVEAWPELAVDGWF